MSDKTSVATLVHIIAVFSFTNRMFPFETAGMLVYNGNFIPSATGNRNKGLGAEICFISILFPS